MNELRRADLEALQELPYAINKVKADVKREPLATLTLPYHPSMMKLRPRLNQMGIRLAFSSSGTLGQQL